jgi:fibronectin type 3 domain-containing protein
MTRFVLISMLCLVVTLGAFAQTLPTPENLTATQVTQMGRAGVLLTWQAPHGQWSFRVSRSVTDTTHFQSIGSVPETLFVDGMITPGNTYFYYVKTVASTMQSGRSNVVSITIAPPPPPPTPTGLTATLVAGGPDPRDAGVRLVWSAPRGQWSFRAYRSQDTSAFMPVGSTNDTQFVDRGVHPGTYSYYVKAVTQQGTQSDPSNTVTITILPPVLIQGTISGTVIDDSTLAPIAGIGIQLFRVGNMWHCSPPIVTDSLGHYSALVDTGSYILRANAMDTHGHTGEVRYRPEYYDNCTEPSCATVVTIAEGATFTANFGLARLTPPSYSHVSGVVKDSNNAPIVRARVSVVRTVQEMNYLGSLGFTPGTGPEEMDLGGVGHTRGVVWTGFTDSLGAYSARVIAGRNYIALASKEGYLPQYFNHKATVETADVIAVGGDTTGIDFSLAVRPVPNNSISGLVKDSAGVGVPSRISLFPIRNGSFDFGHRRYYHTDSLGNYTITALPEGRYFVLAMPFSGYAPGFFKLNSCGVFHMRDADTVAVAGNVTGIDICVNAVGSNGLTVIHGNIRSSSNAQIVGARVLALDAQGQVAGIGLSDATGAYVINAVAPGVVTVIADQAGYTSGQTMATVVANNFSVNNVNITLIPATPTSVSGTGVMPKTFALEQNYPNPFNPSTKISYALPVQSVVTLKIFNVLGQEVATLFNGAAAAGSYDIVWNGKDNSGKSVASGVYLYKLQANAGSTEFSQVRKMVLMK